MNLTAEFVQQAVIVEILSDSLYTVTNPQIVREIVEAPPYEGSYTVTPTAETQILETKHYRMTENLVINPIPSDYGRITWSGAGIRVS